MHGSKTRSPDPLDAHIGAKLARIRKQCGWSQSALGEAVGVSFQQIQKYENAQNRIATSRLIHIARTLNCKINDFIPEEDR